MRINYGKRFESHVQKSLNEENIFNYRLRDNVASWAGGSKMKYGVSNIADYLSFYNGNLFFLEVKSTQGKSLPFNRIRDSQLKGMLDASKYNNIYSFIIVEFRDYDEKYALDIRTANKYMVNADRKSFPLDLFKDHGYKLEILEGKRVLMKFSNFFNNSIINVEKEENNYE